MFCLQEIIICYVQELLVTMLVGVLNGLLHNMLAMKGEIQTMLMNVIDWSHREMDHQTSLCLDCSSKSEQSTNHPSP